MVSNNFNNIEVINDVERLLILIKRLNSTQYKFAEDIGVSPSYIGQIVNYKVPFTHNLKTKINRYMEKALDEADLRSHF